LRKSNQILKNKNEIKPQHKRQKRPAPPFVTGSWTGVERFFFSFFFWLSNKKFSSRKEVKRKTKKKKKKKKERRKKIGNGWRRPIKRRFGPSSKMAFERLGNGV